MVQKKAPAAEPAQAESGLVIIRVLRDGVFVDNGVRADKGDECECDAEIADVLIERGDAKRI